MWNEFWKKTTDCRQSKFFITGYDVKVCKLVTNLDRKLLAVIIQFVTGHGPFGYHLKLTRLKDLDTCRFCNEHREEAWHLFGECPGLSQHRSLVLGRAFLDPPFKVSELIQLLRSSFGNGLFMDIFTLVD